MITTTCRILWIPTGRDACAATGRVTAKNAAASTGRITRRTLAQRGDEDLAVTRPVELAEEDALPAAERELAVAQRHEDLRAHQRGAHVRRGVGPVRVVDVLPGPAVVDDLLERVLEILRHEGVGVLGDRDAGRRVGNVDEGGCRAVRLAERSLYLLRDVQELGLAVGLEADLLHVDILGRQ